jgi:hypothetical protein
LEHLGKAQQDCEQAERFAPGSPDTHACWGYLHLAQREYDRAISQFAAPLKMESQPERQFDMGLALLLGGRLTDAREAYGRGIVEASIAHIELAQRELDFWTTHQPERAESPEAREVIEGIRQELQKGLQAIPS